MVVEHVDVLLHASFTFHAIIDTPGAKKPLASLPVPLLVVAPVISYDTFATLQLSDATRAWTVYVLVPVWQKVADAGHVLITGAV